MEASESWPAHLVRLLRARGIEIDDPQIFARTAWTTDELADALEAENPLGPYELVSLLVGVNDQYRSRPVRAFADEMASLLRRASAYTGGHPSRLLVISIPDWSAAPFAEGRNRVAIAAEIAAYNAMARALSAREGARWADVTNVSLRMSDDASLVASDGLHPSGEMYRRWAVLLLPTAIAALTPPEETRPEPE